MSNYFLILASVREALRESLYDMASGIYAVAQKIFQLFFTITGYQFITDKMMANLFSRIMLVIGVFMMVKLGISLVSYLINPDLIKDKEKGAGKLIMRVVTMLIFIYLLMPLPGFNLWGNSNIDKKYEMNGWIFGALYDLQDRIINQGTISTLILGQDITGKNPHATKNNNLNMSAVTQDIVNTIHKAFMQPIIPDSDSTDPCYEVQIALTNGQVNPYSVLTTKCDDQSSNYYDEFLVEYNGLLAILVGLGLIVIVFLFSFDVAVRLIKLTILRLLSPIPAISYIDPKSSKDGIFANYIKTLTSTYLDLFLRIAIIYLIIYILAYIDAKPLFGNNSGVVAAIGKLIIYISLLFFAGQAPKFIQQALGIKSKGTGLGFGAALLGGSLSGAVSGFATGGLWGAAKGLAGGANAGAQNQWARQNGQNPGGSARQSARQRGAQLGTGEYDPSKSGLGGLLGGRLATAMTHTTYDDLNKTKDAMYAHQGMAAKQKDLIEDFRNGVVDDTSRNLSANQISALKDANIDYDAATGTFVDHSTGNLMDKKEIVDRLQDRSGDHEASAGKLKSAYDDGVKYRQSRIPRAKNPGIGIGHGNEFANLRYRANKDGKGPRTPKGGMSGSGYDNDQNINF